MNELSVKRKIATDMLTAAMNSDLVIELNNLHDIFVPFVFKSPSIQFF